MEDKEFEDLCKDVPEEVVDRIVDEVELEDGKLSDTFDKWFAKVNRKLRAYRKAHNLEVK